MSGGSLDYVCYKIDDAVKAAFVLRQNRLGRFPT